MPSRKHGSEGALGGVSGPRRYGLPLHTLRRVPYGCGGHAHLPRCFLAVAAGWRLSGLGFLSPFQFLVVLLTGGVVAAGTSS
jgi:hypothetical protein